MVLDSLFVVRTDTGRSYFVAASSEEVARIKIKRLIGRGHVLKVGIAAGGSRLWVGKLREGTIH